MKLATKPLLPQPTGAWERQEVEERLMRTPDVCRAADQQEAILVANAAVMSCWRVRYVPVDELPFERSEEALDHGIVVASLTEPMDGRSPGRRGLRKASDVYWQPGSSVPPTTRSHGRTTTR